jgi:hypothetical protein
MSINTVINQVTNPRAALDLTNWGAGAGGGTPALSRVTSGGPAHAPTFGRATASASWTYMEVQSTGAATNAVVPGTDYTVWVNARASVAGPVAVYLQWLNAGGAVITTASGTGTMVANTWGAYSATGKAPTGAVRATLIVRLNTAVTNGATLDATAWLLATQGVYFDGSTPNSNSTMYSWSGTAHASTSIAKIYTPALMLVARPTFDPCPRVEITITDLTPTTNTVTVWRTADGKRQAVRGARKRSMVSADFVIDYEVPLGRVVTYELEVTSGINAQVSSSKPTVKVSSPSGCIQDPLVPGSAVPVYGERGPDGKANLRGQALKTFEYKADMSIIPILGSPDPVALMGQRMAASGVDTSLATRAAQEAANLRNLLQQAPLVLVRPLPGWASALPGLCYMAAGAPAELPVDEAWGGSLIWWELKGDLVAAPTMNVIVPLWTYGDVKALWGTYQQAQTALAGKTYLDVLKSPAGT